MPRQYIKQVSTTLFHGKASDFGSWSGVLEKHKGFPNHQIMLTSSGPLALGSYKIRIITDLENGVKTSVDTGEVLDPLGTNSAMTVFDAVLHGIHLDPLVALSPGETISVVVSSFMRIGPEAIGFNSSTSVTTLLKGPVASDIGEVSKITDRHTEMSCHQVSISSNTVLAAGKYRVRIIPNSTETLECSVDTGKDLEVTGVDSALAQFVGIISGVHLEPIIPLTGGSVISIALSSTVERFDSLLGEAIGSGGLPGHTHVEVDVTDLDKYTQAEVDAQINAHATDANTHTNLILDGQYF